MNLSKMILVVTLLCVLMAIVSCVGSNAGMLSAGSEQLEPVDLRCEYLVDPLGIDVVKPRLSWKLESIQRGQKQSAYRLLVASTAEKLKRNVGDVWDSGVVKSSQSIHVVYDGKALESDRKYFWKVKVWGADKKASGWSKSAGWSMGLLERADWSGEWVSINKGDLKEGAKYFLKWVI